jgi:hypothetical protein
MRNSRQRRGILRIVRSPLQHDDHPSLPHIANGVADVGVHDAIGRNRAVVVERQRSKFHGENPARPS